MLSLSYAAILGLHFQSLVAMGCAASVQRPMTRAELPHGSDPQFDPIVQFDLNQIADCSLGLSWTQTAQATVFL